MMRFVTNRKILHYLTLAAGLAVLLFPIVFLVSSSLKSSADVFRVPFEPIPSDPQFGNYAEAWDGVVRKFLINSVIVALITMVSNVIFCSLAGFALAKYQFRGRGAVIGFVLLTSIVPVDFNIIPLFILARELGLLSTYTGIALPGLVFSFGVFLMMQFAKSIPDDLLEAARIDGCSEIGLFFRIGFPLLRPGIAVLAIFTFFLSWDAFLWPAVSAIRDERFTLPIGLTSLMGNRNFDAPLLMAAIAISLAPVLVLFAAAQRRIVENVQTSGLK